MTEKRVLADEHVPTPVVIVLESLDRIFGTIPLEERIGKEFYLGHWIDRS